MKLATITIAALLGGVVLPSAAFATMNTKEFNGCVIYERAGYWNKVDPTCNFNFIGGGAAVDVADFPMPAPPEDDEEEDPVDEGDDEEPPVDDEDGDDETPICKKTAGDC